MVGIQCLACKRMVFDVRKSLIPSHKVEDRLEKRVGLRQHLFCVVAVPMHRSSQDWKKARRDSKFCCMLMV